MRQCYRITFHFVVHTYLLFKLSIRNERTKKTTPIPNIVLSWAQNTQQTYTVREQALRYAIISLCCFFL